MIELYNQASQGKFSHNDSILIENKFKSIVDDTSYELNAAEDSEPSLYDRIGKQITLFDLMYQMIIMSSNLATNILVEKLVAKILPLQ